MSTSSCNTCNSSVPNNLFNEDNENKEIVDDGDDALFMVGIGTNESTNRSTNGSTNEQSVSINSEFNDLITLIFLFCIIREK